MTVQNVEIVEEAGEDCNYIFGAKVEELETILPQYDSRKIFSENPKIRRVVERLIDGTLSDGGSGDFRELYYALLDGASWHAQTIITCWAIWKAMWLQSCGAIRITRTAWISLQSSGRIFAMQASSALTERLLAMQRISGRLTQLLSKPRIVLKRYKRECFSQRSRFSF